MERIYSAHKTQRNLSTLDKPKSFNKSILLPSVLRNWESPMVQGSMMGCDMN